MPETNTSSEIWRKNRELEDENREHDEIWKTTFLLLEEIGISDFVGISKKASKPLVKASEAYRIPFGDNTFNFVFIGEGGLEKSLRSSEFASEIARMQKPEGFAVFRVKAKDA